MGQTSHPQVETYCEQGKKLLEQGKYLAALEYFQAAVELDAEHVDALYGQVCVYRALGKLDKEAEFQRRMDAVIQKKPSGSHWDLSSMGQLEKARKRYSVLLKQLITVKTDEYGLKCGVYSPDACKELAACEALIESLEQQLKLNRTDFKRKRAEALSRISSGPKDIKRAYRKAKRKYARLIRHNLVRVKGPVRAFEVSSSIWNREKAIRSMIEALDPVNGKSWCSRKVSTLIQRRTNLPRRLLKALKITGIVTAVGVGILLVYLVIRFFWYIIIGGAILLAIIGVFKGD